MSRAIYHLNEHAVNKQTKQNHNQRNYLIREDRNCEWFRWKHLCQTQILICRSLDSHKLKNFESTQHNG